MEKQYRNIGFIFFLFIPLTFFGFYKTYFILSPEFEGSVDIYDHLHASASAIWLGLLISQPLLIRYGNYALHRKLGKFSYVIFPILIFSFIPQMIKSFEEGHSLIHPIFDIVLLLIFYSQAIINKSNTPIHMRYMIAIALIFIGPTLGRIVGHWFGLSTMMGITIPYGIANLIILSLISWDKVNNRNYKPYIVASACFIVYQISLYVVLLWCILKTFSSKSESPVSGTLIFPRLLTHRSYWQINKINEWFI